MGTTRTGELPALGGDGDDQERDLLGIGTDWRESVPTVTLEENTGERATLDAVRQSTRNDFPSEAIKLLRTLDENLPTVPSSTAPTSSAAAEPPPSAEAMDAINAALAGFGQESVDTLNAQSKRIPCTNTNGARSLGNQIETLDTFVQR